MTTAYAIWGLVAPSRWLLWLTLAIALLVLCGRLSGTGLRAMTVLLALGWLLIGVSPLGLWLLRPLEQRFAAASLEQPVSDIVVLTGAEELRESALAGRLEVGKAGERIIEGAALAKRYPQARLWIIGGVRLTKRDPADVDWVRARWIELGVPAERIHVVRGTYDSCQNAAGLRHKAVPDGFLLVTSAFHMPRAMACMRKAGLEPRPWPVDYRGVSGGPFNPLARAEMVDLAVHEYAGLLVYRLTGRIDRLWAR